MGKIDTKKLIKEFIAVILLMLFWEFGLDFLGDLFRDNRTSL
jgi:hypothetical protein